MIGGYLYAASDRTIEFVPLEDWDSCAIFEQGDWGDPRSQAETLTALSHELEGGMVITDGEAGIACAPGNLPGRFMELGSSQGKA